MAILPYIKDQEACMRNTTRKLSVLMSLLFATALIFSCSAAKKDGPTEKGNSPDKSESYKVTFIELGSVNCVPCRMMQPVMENIEETYGKQVRVIFYDVWTEKDKQQALNYGIRVIPTQVFLDADGREYFRHEGFFPEDELIDVLKQKGVN